MTGDFKKDAKIMDLSHGNSEWIKPFFKNWRFLPENEWIFIHSVL
jgi:hypothetical protein